MAKLSWLHLTDLHYGLSGQAPLWPNVKQAFFDDLGRMHGRTGPWQLVLFSGDLVQQGSEYEYQRMEEQVLAPLWEHMKRLGSEPHLLAVPGNHDLVRPDVRRPTAALRMLLHKEGFWEIADELFSSPPSEYSVVIDKAFAAYANWWQKTPFRHPNITRGILPGEFSVTVDQEDLSVGVVGLNTTVLQLAGGDYKGRLAWDVRQFHAACTGEPHGDGPEWVREHRVCLLMTHQGPDWLDDRSNNTVYSEINPAGRFAVHLFGHMHENVVRSSSVGGGRTVRHWQGNSLFSLEKFGDPPKEERRHGYSVGTIEFSSKSPTLRHWPRKAIRDANGWRFEPDTESCVLKTDGGTAKAQLLLQSQKPSSKGRQSLGAKQRLSLSRYSLMFDGSSGHMVIGNLDHKIFAFACWVKRERSRDRSCDGDGEPLIHSTTVGGLGVAFKSDGKEDSDKLLLSKIGVSEVLSTRGITDKEWHHVAVNFDGASATFYIDGVADSPQDCTKKDFRFEGRAYTIGSVGNTRHFKGNLDDVGIFPSLSAEQAKGLYAGTLDPASLSPFALWRFEEGSGTLAADSSGNSHTGTLHDDVKYSPDVPVPLKRKGGGE